MGERRGRGGEKEDGEEEREERRGESRSRRKKHEGGSKQVHFANNNSPIRELNFYIVNLVMKMP